MLEENWAGRLWYRCAGSGREEVAGRMLLVVLWLRASGAGWRSSPAPGSASPESIGNERIFAYLGAKCDLVVEMKPGTRKRTGCDDDGATDAATQYGLERHAP